MGPRVLEQKTLKKGLGSGHRDHKMLIWMVPREPRDRGFDVEILDVCAGLVETDAVIESAADAVTDSGTGVVTLGVTLPDNFALLVFLDKKNSH